MDTVTYPDPDVQRDLLAHFAGLSIDLLAKHPDLKEASGNQRIWFAPTFIATDAAGRELRRWCGWLPPRAFRAELRFIRGYGAMQRGDLALAATLLGEAAAEFGDVPIVPEARYWQGVASFLAGKKDFQALREAWEAVAASHPGSRFGIHASVIEDAPRS
jgi:hypothetical protein